MALALPKLSPYASDSLLSQIGRTPLLHLARLSADLPGVDSKDIDITMENGLLSLRGRRHGETKQEDGGYRRVERVSGEFFRRFALPDSADPEAISAQMSNGVLTVRIGKRAEIQPRRIQVKSS